VTSALDAVWEVTSTVHADLWRLTGVVRPAAVRYVQLLNLAQPWNMFSNPPWFDEYLRIRYIVGRDQPAGWPPSWFCPNEREDRARLLVATVVPIRDKATQVSLEHFFKKRPAATFRPDTRPDELPDDLAPLGPFLHWSIRVAVRASGERVLRTESGVESP
jgi:hypothetical protein